MADVRRLGQLSRADWVVLGQAAVLLPATALAVRLVGFARWQAWLGRRLPGAEDNSAAGLARARQVARQVARLAAAVARRLPGRFSCLERALVVWWLLRRRGLEAGLRIGVRRPGERLEAHAWVECADEVLTDPADVGRRYAAFARAVEPVPPAAGNGR